jgi:hypothetical protein
MLSAHTRPSPAPYGATWRRLDFRAARHPRFTRLMTYLPADRAA